MPHDPHEIIQSRLAEISTETSKQHLDILGRADLSLINITTSSMEDLRDVTMPSPPLLDLYNLLLLVVPFDSSKQPTTNHAAHILQVMRELDVSLTPQSQLTLCPAVILHVWNWIDDATLFRIESEGQTSVSGSKLILEGLTTEQKSLAIFLTETNLVERMELIVETIKELNEFVTSELLTMTVLKKEIVTSAIFLPRAALFVAEGSRQFRKCKSVEPVAVVVAPNRNGDTCLSGRNSNCNGQLDQIHTAKHHLNEEDRPDFIVFSGPHELMNRVFLKILFASGFFYLTYCFFPLSNSHFTEDLSPNTHIPFTARVRVPLIFDRLSVFTGFQHIPSRDMPNLFLINGITNSSSPERHFSETPQLPPEHPGNAETHIWPDIPPPPTPNQFVTSIAALLKQIMLSAIAEREMTQFVVHPTTEMDAIRDHR
ncbi:hypothetical protein BLNAU_12335 [Blattamonas nauphoetae]|uniref:Uncharacterized protein n=1 Tax=Blattamonas nauphoetae TaxID=2049346 RepID=A0ABQ9XJT2_9EUKA|nr:hypothetical protein BLNAU_12335 [Blattamonas nauphoetae]